MPIDSFFICEVVEVVKLLEKMRDRLKFEHELQYIAICNALGKNFSKNYKYNDIFDKKDNKKKEVTQEEKENLKSYFDKWSEVNYLSALTKELKVRITADANGLKGALNAISSDISKVGKDFEGLKSLGNGISSVGKALTAGLTLPIVGVGVASAKTASDFQGAMKEVSAISGATGKDLDSLSNLAKEMGSTTKFSASESAEALNIRAVMEKSIA